MAGKGKLVSKFIKGQADELSSAGKAIKSGVTGSQARLKKNLMPNGKVSAGGIANSVLLSDAPRGRHIENLYTGKRLNGKLIGGVGVAGALAVGGGANNMFGAKSSGLNNPSDVKSIFDINQMTAVKASAQGAEEGINPNMAADGAGTAKATKSKAQTLNAQGDMVFGMHNTRKK